MLRTCTKCGKQFYGAGCPECDFPPQPADAGPRKADRIWGLLFMAVGVSVAVEVLARPQALPPWLGFVAGGIFFLGGLGTVPGVKGRLASTLGGMVCAGMASLGFFAAFGPGEVEGGVPFLPESWNQGLGRIACGGGACFAAAYCLWLFYRAVKPCRRKRPDGQPSACT